MRTNGHGRWAVVLGAAVLAAGGALGVYAVRGGGSQETECAGETTVAVGERSSAASSPSAGASLARDAAPVAAPEHEPPRSEPVELLRPVARPLPDAGASAAPPTPPPAAETAEREHRTKADPKPEEERFVRPKAEELAGRGGLSTYMKRRIRELKAQKKRELAEKRLDAKTAAEPLERPAGPVSR